VLAVPSAIHPVTGSHMDSQLRHALADRFRIAQIAGFDLAQPYNDPSFRFGVTKCCHPLSERISTALFVVVDDLDHDRSVA